MIFIRRFMLKKIDFIVDFARFLAPFFENNCIKINEDIPIGPTGSNNNVHRRQ